MLQQRESLSNLNYTIGSHLPSQFDCKYIRWLNKYSFMSNLGSRCSLLESLNAVWHDAASTLSDWFYSISILTLLEVVCVVLKLCAKLDRAFNDLVSWSIFWLPIGLKLSSLVVNYNTAEDVNLWCDWVNEIHFWMLIATDSDSSTLVG